jgi:signal transduction histidine kinase
MTKAKILIVEDEAIVAEDIAFRLEKMGFSVTEIVASGEEAIASALSNQPDLILMDIMLQGDMDGITAANEIYQQIKKPIIYLTANADDSTIKKAQETQPFGYVLKPFKEKELTATIEIALSRHQNEMNMQEAIRLKNEYLSMASHEFKTPLSIIKLAAGVLNQYEYELSPEQKEKYLENIDKATNTINDLINDILTLTKTENGQIKVALSSLNPDEFCQEVINYMQMTVKDTHKFIYNTHGEFAECLLDEKLLWHILNNLLSNAVKYSPKGRKIYLTLSSGENRIIIEIKDQGIGMPEYYQKSLFQPFKRASNVGNIPGTGLGLSIVKKAVEMLEGEIAVQSIEGEGTTFTVFLPVKK